MTWRVLMSLWMLLVAGGVHAQPAQHPAAHFARLPTLADPALSPDGTRVAARMARDGKQMLAILTLDGDGAPPVTVDMGNRQLNWWRWVNNEWLVAGIGMTRRVEGTDWYFRRAIGVSINGGTTAPFGRNYEGQNSDTVIWTARDGSPRILLGLQRTIYNQRSVMLPSRLRSRFGSGESTIDEPDFWPAVAMVDVPTGRMRRIIAPQLHVLNWSADPSGVVRMGMGFDRRRSEYKLLYRDRAGQAFRRLRLAPSGGDPMAAIPAVFPEPPARPIAFSFIEGYKWLYEIDPATMKIGQRVLGFPGRDIDDVILDADQTRIAGVRYTDDRPRAYWLDAGMADAQASLDAAVPGLHATILSLSRDLARMIVRLGTASQPGGYYLYDRPAGRLRRFAFVNDAFAMATLGPVRTVRYTARDGLEMTAVLTLPPGRDARKLPLVVLPHGGPAARDSETYDWIAQFLADRGYAVVQPNYRGSTGFGARFQLKGDGQWGLAMQDDLNDAVAHLAHEGIADPGRVCMAGGSYGGYAALRAAQRDGAAYRCVVSFAGVSDLRDMAGYDSQFLFGRTLARDWKAKAADLGAVSPVRGAAAFGSPVLLLHGAKDLRVPVRQSRIMAQKLREAGKEVRYVEQSEGDHHFSREADRLQILQEMEAFLNRHNPA